MVATVDARGLSCPVPVIKTKEALDKGADEVIVVLVDEEAAKENVSRLATSYGYEVAVADEAGEYRLTLSKGGDE